MELNSKIRFRFVVGLNRNRPVELGIVLSEYQPRFWEAFSFRSSNHIKEMSTTRKIEEVSFSTREEEDDEYLPNNKRIKSDEASTDASSETADDSADTNKLERMAGAIKTILEVRLL